MPIGFVVLILAALRGGTCALTNRTIDDYYGDSVTGAQPLYLPENLWTQGNQCGTCNIHPGIVTVDQTFNGTWHDSTYHPGQPEHSITVGFTGVAVYVYNLVANSYLNPFTTTFTNLSFSIDGKRVGGYEHKPDPTQDIEYDVLVFAREDLANERHTLNITMGGTTSSLILFDYIVYTVDDGDPAQPQPSESTSSRRPSLSTSIFEPFPSTSTFEPSPSTPIFEPSVRASSYKLSAPITQTQSSTSAQVSASSSPNPISHHLTAPARVALATGLSVAFVVTCGILVLLTLRKRRMTRSPSSNPLRARYDPSGASSVASQASGTLWGPALEQPRLSSSSKSNMLSRTETPPRLPEKQRPVRVSSSSWHGRAPRRGADVPEPALSVTGTERSRQFAELAEEVRELEKEIRELRSKRGGSYGSSRWDTVNRFETRAEAASGPLILVAEDVGSNDGVP